MKHPPGFLYSYEFDLGINGGGLRLSVVMTELLNEYLLHYLITKFPPDNGEMNVTRNTKNSPEESLTPGRGWISGGDLSISLNANNMILVGRVKMKKPPSL